MAHEAGTGGPAGGEQWQTPGSGVICPQCGVTVAPGYPKCPKCHAGLPHVPSPLQQVGAQVSGGTTAAGADGGAGIWIVAAIIVLIAGAIALFAVRGRGRDRAPEVAAAGDAGEVVVDPPVEEVDGPAEGGGAAAPGQDGDDDVAAYQLLEDLGAKLSEQRLWASVEQDATDDTVVRIVSAHCDEGELHTVIDAYASALAQAGYAQVQCYSQHGTLDYERAL